jgi:SAM-dependent methyltransferase
MDELRRRYDAIIHVHRLVRYDLISSLRLTQLCPELFWLRDQAHRNADEFGLHMREMPHLDGDLAKRAVLKGLNRKSLLGFSGGLPISGDDPIFLSPTPAALQIFQLTGLEPGRYITIHDGFDTFHRIRSRRSTKQWPASYWQDLIDGLRNRHPGTKIVQVGGGHSQPYRGIDTNLVGKATFDQVAWLLKYAVCHIDGESGLVRLAHEMAGRSVVMFGPTDAGFFAFPENVNLLPESCGNCFWSTPEWLAQCPRGLEEPECTRSITPRRALDAVDQVIRARADILPTFVQASSLAREEAPTPADNEPVARAQQQVRLLASELAAWMPTSTIRTALVAPASSGVPLRLALAQLGRVEGVWFHVAEAGANRHAWRQALQNSGTRAEGPKGFTERLADPLNIPSGDHAFDLLVLSTTSSTRYELEFSMREMLRILRPGGLLFYAPPHLHESNGKDHGARGLRREELSAGANLEGCAAFREV